MLQALNTGHSGSLSTGHGNSPRDMLSRLETMVLMAAELPLPAVRSQIASAIDILVHLGRLRDGSRKVLEIVEVGTYADGEIQLNPLYRFEEETGEADDGAADYGAGGQSGGKKEQKRGAGKVQNSTGTAGENAGKVRGCLVKVGELQATGKLRSAGYSI